MSSKDTQTTLGKNLFQINANTLRGMAELQRDNIEKYFELNANYWERIGEVGEFTDFFELQRDYNESMWNGFKESVQSQTGLIKDALEESSGAVKAAFIKEEEPAPAKAAKKKPRKAKKAAAKVAPVKTAESDSLPH